MRSKPGQPIDKETLTACLREHLAHHKTRRHGLQLDAFSLTGSGKIKNFKLRAGWSRGEFKEI